MSEFDAQDLPPDLRDVADRLRGNRYEAGALELDQIKTRILKRGSGRRAVRGRRMRKRTFVTALIMFAAIGTGSAGAVGFGGNFFSFGSLFSTHHAAKTAPVASPFKAPVAPTTTAAVTTGGQTPSAFCIQYGCNTTTTVSCTPVTLSVLGFTILPSVCTVTVTNTTNAEPPTGTVVVTAGGQTKTCVLVPSSGSSSRCNVTFSSFAGNLINVGTLHIGLLSPLVTANYLGAPGFQPSSGTTRFLVTISIL